MFLTFQQSSWKMKDAYQSLIVSMVPLIQIHIKISVTNFCPIKITYLCCLIQSCVTLKSGGSGSGSGAGGLNLMGFCVCCFRIRSIEDGLKRLFCKWASFGGLGGGSIAEAGFEVTITLDFSDSEDESWFVEQLKNACFT